MMTLSSMQLIVLYTAIGAAIVLLLMRMARQRREPADARTTTTHAPEEMRPHASRAARSDDARVASWDDRRLFQDSARLEEAPTGDVPAVAARDIPSTDVSDRIFGSLTPTLAEFLPETASRRARTAAELLNAGYYNPHAEENLAALRFALMMFSIVVFGVLLILVPPAFEGAVLLGLVTSTLLSWALPRLYVTGRAADRKNDVEHAMPDMLDMLNMCVSQGLTVPASLSRISRDLRPVYPALAKELNIVSEQTEIGTLEHALGNFADRVDAPEVHSFCSLVIQTERMGTSISDALGEYAENMREGMRQQADQKANQATFKLLFPTVLCLMPAVYMVLLGPAITELSDFFGGTGGSSQISRSLDAVRDIQPIQR